jgi:hypothetical protein
MLFPLVPLSPGVPFVNRLIDQAFPTSKPATTDAADVAQQAAATPQWGVFLPDGTNVLNPDSCFALDDFNHEFRLSTFPIEEGSFSTFNKVATPFEGRFIFNKGGPQTERTTFLQTLETVVADTNLYILATPELTYPNVNIPRYRLRRRADAGFQLISVEVVVQEVRVAAPPKFSNTADPTAQTATTTGAVQPATPTSANVAQAQSDISPEGVGTLVVGQPGGLRGPVTG